MANPKKALSRAYFGSIAIVMPFYVLVGIVVAGHLSLAEVEAHSDYSLSAAARSFLGDFGAVGVVVAAMIATSSAMNAIFYGSGRLVYRIARAGQLPTELEREIRGQHLEGMLIFGLGALALANFVPLDAIAMTGSAGFLLVYCSVNVANVLLGKKTHSRRWISVVAAIACFGAFVALIIRTVTNPETRWHFVILLGFVVGALIIEGIYRGLTGRQIRVIEEDDEEDRGSLSVT